MLDDKIHEKGLLLPSTDTIVDTVLLEVNFINQ
jgi:hypothetical protein